jgi:hypothetical protein
VDAEQNDGPAGISLENLVGKAVQSGPNLV